LGSQFIPTRSVIILDLVAEINAPLIQGNNRTSLTANIMLKDSDAKYLHSDQLGFTMD
jgi:hypothetical protein